MNGTHRDMEDGTNAQIFQKKDNGSYNANEICELGITQEEYSSEAT